MDGLIDIAAFDGVLVHVFQLLHHGVAADLLGLAPLLPQLVLALRFVPQLKRAELAGEAPWLHEIAASR